MPSLVALLSLILAVTHAVLSSPHLSTHSRDLHHNFIRGAPSSNANAGHQVMAGSNGNGGVGKEPAPKDGWRDTTITWYDGDVLADPACYNGAESSQGTAPDYQPDDSSMIAAIVPSYGYAECYDFIEISRFDATAKNGTAPAASIIVQVIDFCASGCESGKNMTWFDLTKGAFSKLYTLNLGEANVKWRKTTKDKVPVSDRSKYPAWPNGW
ncbi:hypothetical protein BOTBODRAFT_57544 [Botryobasidium botryosum FD-172 SS1]|uniref:RlpA-like protein double-psi beta-barrel domain-containing protein n=1 Tax=Botryobasidium botryosum (strain FD-172 SS1) TaxID=930990 RepID=A0A067MH29_BOTB1|nr:hypothetical protein BOTBODRAFT_57544 [Botryobasidium botryosum FD-172 SS1]